MGMSRSGLCSKEILFVFVQPTCISEGARHSGIFFSFSNRKKILAESLSFLLSESMGPHPITHAGMTRCGARGLLRKGMSLPGLGTEREGGFPPGEEAFVSVFWTCGLLGVLPIS